MTQQPNTLQSVPTLDIETRKTRIIRRLKAAAYFAGTATALTGLAYYASRNGAHRAIDGAHVLVDINVPEGYELGIRETSDSSE